MVNKISLGSLSVPLRLISRIREMFSNSPEAVSGKPWGEPPPPIADISRNPLLQSLFGNLLERLHSKLKNLSGRGARFVPAHGTIAMANSKEGLVYVGVEFLEQHYQDEEAIAGVLAHEWGHLIEELPPGFDPDLLNYDQLWELRREKEAEADSFAGRALYRMGYTPKGFVRFLQSIPKKYETQKYFSIATRAAIIEKSYAAEQKKLVDFKQLF